MKRKWKWSLAAVAAAAVMIVYLKGCVARPDFDPKVIASAETKMWQAYYSGDKKSLAYQLAILERTQFGLSWTESALISKDLAEAASEFIAAGPGSEERILLKLTAAYARIKTARGMAFDPEAAARAELDWWVARRDPARKSVESVGSSIGALYAVLYGSQKPEFQKAGRLRAEAAAIRDAGQAHSDWKRIELLLDDSYEALASGVPSARKP